jgi:hypothetical protein
MTLSARGDSSLHTLPGKRKADPLEMGDISDFSNTLDPLDISTAGRLPIARRPHVFDRLAPVTQPHSHNTSRHNRIQIGHTAVIFSAFWSYENA